MLTEVGSEEAALGRLVHRKGAQMIGLIHFFGSLKGRKFLKALTQYGTPSHLLFDAGQVHSSHAKMAAPVMCSALSLLTGMSRLLHLDTALLCPGRKE
jgi:hypothetical protein